MRFLRALAVPLACAIVPATTLLAQPSGRDGLVISLAAEGGAYPRVENPHLVYGGSAQVRLKAFGILGLGLLGTSDEYESQMALGALTVRVFRAGPVNASLLGGYGQYQETGYTGIERSAPGFVGGATLFVESGWLALRVTAFDFRGRYDGQDVLAPFSFSAPRVTVGLGLNVLP